MNTTTERNVTITGPLDLKTLRLLCGKSQAQLAADVGRIQSVISRIERGRFEPGIGLARKIAGALSVSIDLIRFPSEGRADVDSATAV